MNLKEEILQPYSRQQKLKVAHYVGADPKRFDELMQLFLAEDYRLSQRSSNLISHCVEQHPALINNYLATLIGQLNQPVHNAVKRNVVRLLQFVDIPESLAGEVMNACFDLITLPGEPVANKTFALTVLEKLSRPYPDIRQEMRLVIEDQLPRTSAAFHSRARKILPHLP